MPDPEEEEIQESDRDTRVCPFCGETILAAARKCKFCKEMLDESPAPAAPPAPRPSSAPRRLAGQAHVRKFTRDLVRTGERHSHAGAIIVLVAAVIGAAAVFMPWGSVTWGFGRSVATRSWNGFGASEGTIAFIGFCAAAALAIALYNTRAPATQTVLSWIIVSAGALSALCSLIVLGKGQGWSVGIGLILSVLAGAGVAVGGFLLTRFFGSRPA